MIPTMMKVAAAILMTLGGGAYLVGSRTAAAGPFAEVARRLREAHAVSFREVVEVPGLPALVSRILYREPGQYRREMADGSVILTDLARNEALVLDAKKRVATTLHDTDPEAQPADGLIEHLKALRNLVPQEGKPVGTRMIAGVEVQGVQIPSETGDLTIWYDPTALLPVAVDVSTSLGAARSRVLIEGIVLDPKVDDDTFRLKIPAGYQQVRRETVPITIEEAVAVVLRTFASRAGGKFPTSLDDPTSFAPALRDELKDETRPEAERLRLAQAVGVVGTLRFTTKDRGYRAAEVHLGEATKPVFWYRPDGAMKFRVLFGDLHWGDLDGSDLPK